MNKNPERPKDMERIMTKVLNPKSPKVKTEMEKYWENQKKVLEGVFR